jgi:hypothetical protein
MSTRAAGQAGGRGVPQMWSGVSDEVLVPDAALPSQFGDIWYRSRSITPERSLALAVLTEAVVDLQKYRFATRRRQQRMYWEAYQWVVSGDRLWPFSFINLCEINGMDPVASREHLLGEMAPPQRDEFPSLDEIVEAA